MTNVSVAAVSARLQGEFERLGFRVSGRRPLKLVLPLNDETEVFAYPGVNRSGMDVLIDPVLGVDNVRLRERMRRSERPWRDPRVCHAYLGMLDTWGRFLVRTESDMEAAVRRVMESVVNVGIPALQGFDSLDSVAALLEAKIRNQGPIGIAVLFPEEKLDLLRQLETRST